MSTTRLKRVVSMSAGGTPPVDDPAMWDDGGLPWVAIADMTRSPVVTKTERGVSVTGVDSKRLTVGQPGTLLFAMYASVGATATLGVEATWNQAILGLASRSDRADLRFVRYWLEHLRPHMGALIRSNTQDNLNAEQVSNFPFPTLALDEQRAIADYLDRETARNDSLIAAKQRIMTRLSERKLAYVEERMTLGQWPTTALRRILLSIDQGWSPQCEARLPEGGEWGVLKVGCVNGGWFKTTEVKALPAELEPRREYLVRDGDLLMSRANTRDLVGSVALATSVPPRTLLSDKLYRIRLDTSKADPRFISLWLQTRAVRSTFELDATGASDSMQNIGQDTVRRVRVPLPPLDEQSRLVADCELDRERGRILGALIQRQISLLREHRQTLITAAVTGQLEVPVTA